MKSITTFLLVLFFNNFVYSQNEITISYNESISLENLNDNIEFIISGDSGEIHLRGEKINEYVFEKPGEYTIKIIDRNKVKKNSCEDTHLPQNIHLTVSRIMMIYDGKNIAFSNPILKNRPTDDIVLSIPVTISTYDHQPIALNATTVNSAGIGTFIVANLIDSKKALYDGTHILKYALSGLVTQNSYLMFDFIDANNRVQSISLLTPIQD